MPRTGDKATQSGIYRGDDADRVEIALSRNETFPPCRDCQRAVNWSLTISSQP
jgi:hypothetical protein